VINIEGFSGNYLASNLHVNNHYAIRCCEDRLKRYLEDAVRMGLPLRVVMRDDDGNVRYAMTEVQDVVIITPGNTAIVLDSLLEDGESLAFMNLSDLNMSETQMADLKSLNHERALDLLTSNPIFGDTEGARERKQTVALNYQYCGMNSTDRSHSFRMCPEAHLEI
jgi:hypothetical protein